MSFFRLNVAPVRNLNWPLVPVSQKFTPERSFMALNLFDSKGCDISRQRFNWKDLVQKPISKLDDDAFTRVRVILMNGIELDSLRTKQVALRMNRDARVTLAQLMRTEQHQATMINCLISPDHSPL